MGEIVWKEMVRKVNDGQSEMVLSECLQSKSSYIDSKSKITKTIELFGIQFDQTIFGYSIWYNILFNFKDILCKVDVSHMRASQLSCLFKSINLKFTSSSASCFLYSLGENQMFNTHSKYFFHIYFMVQIYMLYNWKDEIRQNIWTSHLFSFWHQTLSSVRGRYINYKLSPIQTFRSSQIS